MFTRKIEGGNGEDNRSSYEMGGITGQDKEIAQRLLEKCEAEVQSLQNEKSLSEDKKHRIAYLLRLKENCKSILEDKPMPGFNLSKDETQH